MESLTLPLSKQIISTFTLSPSLITSVTFFYSKSFEIAEYIFVAIIFDALGE